LATTERGPGGRVSLRSVPARGALFVCKRFATATGSDGVGGIGARKESVMPAILDIRRPADGQRQ
jgi:hypothetical protein